MSAIALGAFALTVIINDATIAEGFRSWWLNYFSFFPKVAKAVYCNICVGFWMVVIFSVIKWLYYGVFFERILYDLGLCYILLFAAQFVSNFDRYSHFEITGKDLYEE